MTPEGLLEFKYGQPSSENPDDDEEDSLEQTTDGVSAIKFRNNTSGDLNFQTDQPMIFSEIGSEKKNGETTKETDFNTDS